jgi:hypothetical protein
MLNGNFLGGLQGLTEWLGYLILPTLAGFCVVLAVLNYREGRGGERYITAALVCLMGPACALLVSAFVTHASPVSGGDAASGALMNALNWTANVLLPLLAAYNVAHGVLEAGGVLKPRNSLMGRAHYFIVAFGCLTVSGVLRLLEHFVTTAKAVTLLQPLLHLSGGLNSCLFV